MLIYQRVSFFFDDLSIYGHLTNNTRPKKYGANYLKSQTNGRLEEEYPLVNKHNYGKSPFLTGKSTINDHFQ